MSATPSGTPSGRVLAAADGAWIAISDGLVVDRGTQDPPADAEQLGDVILGPGFVDLQMNGIDAIDFWRATPDEWRRAGARVLASGATSYLPTLVTAPFDGYDDALARVAAAQADARSEGLAQIEGVHLEGPFLGAAPGAHPVDLIRPMDVEWLLGLLDRHPGLVRLVTLAPEADRELDGVRALRARGVVVALGHSRCSAAEAHAAADAGATAVTHLFNGMGPLDHRQPGLVVAALSDPRLTPSLIADFVHVDREVVDLALRLRSCALITDAVAVGIEYFGQEVVDRNGAAFLADGTLTGSTLTMDRAVRNVAELIGVQRAIELAAVVPGAELGLPTFGVRGLGGRADLVALDRKTLEVTAVWLAGTPA